MRRRGFTLIELLVVIAIIGILAAMLFPVFARARESARKIQCLSNVKNIALAVNMYLTDYDMLWPAEHRPEVIAGSHPDHPDSTNGCAMSAGTKMNPYLKPPVILDEYIKNRDVWSCPSARASGSWGILNPLGGDWWARALSVDPSTWGEVGIGQCGGGNYPPGWGGALTDTITQGKDLASNPAAFHNSLATIQLREVKTSQMNDVAKYVIVSESQGSEIWGPLDLAYPDASAMCGANPGSVACCGGSWVDWENCAWSRDCGASGNLNYADGEVRKQWGHARHLGGSNVGFADGHAKWYNSEDILNSYAPIDGVVDHSSYRWECFGDPAVLAQLQKRDTWEGFYGGICGMWGAFGLSPNACS